MQSLASLPVGRTATVRSIAGARAFRRRLLEMGLVPGVDVKIVTVAPLGDPLQIEVRHGQWSIRKAEAAQIEVVAVPNEATVAVTPSPDEIIAAERAVVGK